MNPSSSTMKRAAAMALALLFAAHAFCFFNLTFSGASVMVNAAKGADAQIVSGRYLQTLYWRVRGPLAAPLLVGLLCALYLTLAVLITAALLHLTRPASLFLLCGTMIVHPAVTSLFAASLHTADASLLGLLLACAGAAACLRSRGGAVIGACLFAAALALEETALSCAAALLLLALLRRVLTGEPVLSVFIRAALALAAGCALYAAGYFLACRAYGLGPEAVLRAPRGGSLWGAWLYPIGLLFAPLTAYPALSAVLCALLMLLCAALLPALLRPLPKTARALALLALLALPLAVNLPAFSTNAPGQTRLSFCFLGVLAVLLLDAGMPLAPRAVPLRRAACGAFSVLFLGGAIFANQVYLKKNLEFTSTLSIMTRVLSRIEETDGFVPGATPVAIIGTPEDSVYGVPHRGFERLYALEAAANHTALVSSEDAVWYMWEVMGYPLSVVSDYERSVLEQSETVQAMPAFPAQGCCQFIGETLVIRLS